MSASAAPFSGTRSRAGQINYEGISYLAAAPNFEPTVSTWHLCEAIPFRENRPHRCAAQHGFGRRRRSRWSGKVPTRPPSALNASAADSLRKRAGGALSSKRKKALPSQRIKTAVSTAGTENFFFTRARVFAAQKTRVGRRQANPASAGSSRAPMHPFAARQPSQLWQSRLIAQ
jgi:hypothetical protein